jgi:hypothetical protein
MLYPERARARNTHVEYNLNHSFPAPDLAVVRLGPALVRVEPLLDLVAPDLEALDLALVLRLAVLVGLDLAVEHVQLVPQRLDDADDAARRQVHLVEGLGRHLQLARLLLLLARHGAAPRRRGAPPGASSGGPGTTTREGCCVLAPGMLFFTLEGRWMRPSTST